MLGVVSKLMVFRTISSNFVWILGKNIHNWRVKTSFSRMSTTICLCQPFLFQFLLYVRFKKTSNVLNLVTSEHVPQVNVQIHIVVVLKNTKCSKHIREVAKVVPAAHVLNPLSLGTRRSSHKTTSPQVMSEGDARLLLMLWELSHCARTLEWRELSRYTRRSSFTKLATVGMKPPPKDTYALGLPLQKEV